MNGMRCIEDFDFTKTSVEYILCDDGFILLIKMKPDLTYI
jgi:hypothetical protein